MLRPSTGPLSFPQADGECKRQAGQLAEMFQLQPERGELQQLQTRPGQTEMSILFLRFLRKPEPMLLERKVMEMLLPVTMLQGRTGKSKAMAKLALPEQTEAGSTLMERMEATIHQAVSRRQTGKLARKEQMPKLPAQGLRTPDGTEPENGFEANSHQTASALETPAAFLLKAWGQSEQVEPLDRA